MNNYYIYAAILFAVLLIGLYLIFSKRNESGWKAFVPLVNTYVLGKLANRPDLGKKLTISLLTAILSGAGMIYCISTDTRLTMGAAEDTMTVYALAGLAFGFVFLIALIVTFLLTVLVFKNLLETKEAFHEQ